MSDELLPDPELGADAGHQTSPPLALSDIDLQTLLPGFVLGTLAPNEMLAVEVYLQDHPEWQARSVALAETITSLAHAAPRAPLPAQGREQLLQRARADTPLLETRRAVQPTGRLRPLAAAAPPPSPPVRGMRPIPAVQPQSERARLGWFGIFWRAVGVTGALAAIALLAAIGWRLQQTVSQLTAQMQTLQTELAQVQQVNNQLQQESLTRQTQLEQQINHWGIIAAADQVISLAGQAEMPNAQGKFYRRGNAAVLVLSGLPQLADGETYQLWLLPTLDHSIPSEVFLATNNEAELLSVALDPAISDLVGVGVSIEPAGGSQTPTTVVLLGSAP